GGAIAVSALGNITTGVIDASGSNSAGNITLSSDQGAINTSGEDVTAGSVAGNGGAIALSAARTITTGAIDTRGALSGGGISLTGGENITTSTLRFGSNSGSGGDALTANTPQVIDFSAGIFPGGADIVIGNVTPPSNILLPDSISSSGNLTLNLASAFTLTDAVSTAGKNFTLTSPGAIAIQNSVNTDGGNITVSGDQINAIAGILNSSSNTRSGGAITLNATGTLQTANLNSSSTSNQGGTISLNSNAGGVTTGNLNASGATDGGEIRVEARTRITTQEINTSGTTGRGGNVILDPQGDIQVSSINAQGGTFGGNVDITTARFFRATDTFSDRNGLAASISTAGGNTGGNITIRHGGGGFIPLQVGDATTNGTKGAITSGDFTIAPVRSFPFTTTQGNIKIISVDSPPLNPVDFSPPPLTTTTPSVLVSPSLLSIDSPITQFEQNFTDAYTSYLGISEPTSVVSLEQAQASLQKVEQATGIKPALIYAVCVPTSNTAPSSENSVQKQDRGVNTGNKREFNIQASKESSLTPLSSQSAIPNPQASILWQFNSFGLSSTPEAALSLAQSTDKANEELLLILVTSQGQPIQHRVEGVSCANILAEAKTFRSQVTDPRNRKGYLAPAQQLYQWLVAPLEKDLQAKQINNLVFILDAGLRSIPL
ncbi:MAG TPA: CHAT domain-containing protein, partial [Stenomitos sp.]